MWVNANPDDPNTVHPETQVDAWRDLIDELRDRGRSLGEANRENRCIIAALTWRIPELSAADINGATEPRESPETPTAQPGTVVGGQPAVEHAQEPAQPPRCWWRRVCGG